MPQIIDDHLDKPNIHQSCGLINRMHWLYCLCAKYQ